PPPWLVLPRPPFAAPLCLRAAWQPPPRFSCDPLPASAIAPTAAARPPQLSVSHPRRLPLWLVLPRLPCAVPHPRAAWPPPPRLPADPPRPSPTPLAAARSPRNVP